MDLGEPEGRAAAGYEQHAKLTRQWRLADRVLTASSVAAPLAVVALALAAAPPAATAMAAAATMVALFGGRVAATWCTRHALLTERYARAGLSFAEVPLGRTTPERALDDLHAAEAVDRLYG